MKRIVIIVFLASLGIASGAAGQVATGTPKFSSFGGGEFDTVNLGNLNVHLSVPVVHKAGRGMPFQYDLAYDNAVWYPTTVNGNLVWQPVFNWGWIAQSAIKTGYLSYAKITNNCDIVGKQYIIYRNFVYHDAWGINHAFGAFNPSLEYDPNNCDLGTRSSFTSTIQDGSGFTLNAVLASSGNYLTTHTLTNAAGEIINVPLNLTSGYSGVSATATDANGNQISVASTSNTATFTDTFGTTAVYVTGSATPTSPLNLQYTGPAGATSVLVHYTNYLVKTNFGCSGVGNYGGSGGISMPLVSDITLPDGSQYLFTYETTLGAGNSSYKTGRLASVTLPTGGMITYTYTGGSYVANTYNGITCSDGSTASLQRQLNPGGTWQYSRSGANPAWTTTVIDPSSNYTVISMEKDTASTNLYETQRLSYQGNTGGTLLRTDIACYNGQNIGTPNNCYNTGITSPITRITTFSYLPNSTGLQSETDTTYDTFGLLREVDEYDYGSGVVGNLIRKTITTYAALGNGIVDRPSSVLIKDVSNNVKASTTYGYDETAVSPPSGTTPQHISVSGARGSLTSVNVQGNTTIHLYRKYTYYDTGMLKTSTDVSTSSATNGATTTYNYNNTGTPSPSCGNSFVTSISEPVAGMSRSFMWDCTGGVLLSVTDENGKTSNTAYSGTNYTNNFWRPYSATDEASTTTDYFYLLSGSTPPVEFQTESKYHIAFNGGMSTVDRVTTSDGFGRTVFSQTRQGPSASNYDTVATCYDSSGRVSFSTLPYSATLVSSTTPCPSTNAGTSTTYDALGQTATVTDSGGGSTSYSYPKNDILQTNNSPTVSKQSEFDALGRLKSVCEITSGTAQWPTASCNQSNPATGYLTSYTYDALGNLIGVTQNNQATGSHQTRSYIYDMLGRLVSETNPENNNSVTTYAYDSLTSDPACGTITSAGNLLKRLDAAGNATCYSGYDALHRVGAIIYPSSSTPAKHFVYDTATVNGTTMLNAKTRLAEAYTCIGTCSSKVTDLGFSYAPTGQQSDTWELTPHSGTNVYYHVTSTFWPNGLVNTLSNLGGLPTITFGADGEGRMSTVSASSGQNPVTSVTYSAASQVTAITYGSADNDSFTPDPQTGRITQYQFSMGTAPQRNTGVLTWNTNGSLQKLVITDQINSLNTQTCNYTHDDLGRITSADCGCSVFDQNFSYDPFGNLAKSVPGTCSGTSSAVSYDNTNLTNRITTAPYSYTNTSDPNAKTGNMTVDNSHNYGWDTENRLTAIDSGTTNGVCITYDALDRVVEQAKGSTCNTSFAEIVYGPSGAKLALMNGSALTKAFISVPGGAQAVYNASGLQYYRHPDWLGSSRLATTPSRTLYYDGAYAPFGENYAASGTQDLSFTGQNQDTESSGSGGAGGVYDFMFRKHSPVQGRWLSPDPAGLAAANPADPQSWNRYAYVGNRPLNTTDSLGLVFCGIDLACCLDFFIGAPDPIGCGPWLPPLPPGIPPEPPDHPPTLRNHGPFQPQRHGGVWPDNETLGLPAGLGRAPFGLGDLLDLLPGCAPSGGSLGLGFLSGSMPGAGRSPSPCTMLLITVQFVEAIGAFALESKLPKVHGETLDCNLSKPDTKPVFLVCLYECRKETATEVIEESAQIPLYRIQKACPPKRPNCPISLQAKFLGVSFGGIEGDIVAHVVPDSCKYSTVP